MLIRLGTRASALATTQSQWCADLLRAKGHDVELVEIRTEGDVRPGSLTKLGGTGVFAAALREALLANSCDIAVHSCKDLPTAAVPGLTIAAIPVRERSDDVLCARDGLKLAELPAGAKIGTGSPRRAAQIRALRNDVELVDIRGNVGTRLARVAPDDLDAVVLAGAGLARLGLAAAITESLPILPAPAQGALAIECRSKDLQLQEILAEIDDRHAHWEAEAERAILARLGAGCAAPVGGRATLSDTGGTLEAVVVAVDGSAERRIDIPISFSQNPVQCGYHAADELLAQGAADITDLHAAKTIRATHSESLWSPDQQLDGMRVLMPQPLGALAQAVTAAGAEVIGLELTSMIVDEQARVEVTATLIDYDWVVLSSARTANLLGEALAGVRVAAVGAATATAAASYGALVDLIPSDNAGAAALAEIFPTGNGRVLIPGSALAGSLLAEEIAQKGWEIVQRAIYTIESVVPEKVPAVDVAVATAS